MKTAAQAAQKWDASTAQGGQVWLENLQRTTKPIVSKAIEQRAVMQANFAQATAQGGRWQTNLEKVGDAGIKSAAQAKQGNYAQGVSQAQPKFASAIAKILAYEAAGLPQIYAMPKGTLQAGVARATAWIQYMAAGKGTLSAS